MSHLLSSDSFEIIDDPTELISHRSNAVTTGATSHGGGDSANLNGRHDRPGSDEDLSRSNASSSRRKLPDNFLPPSSSRRTEQRKPNDSPLLPDRGVSSPVPSAPASATNGSSARVWNPPPRPRDRELKEKAANMLSTLQHGQETIPTVGGSGARVPNRFLDSQGQFENGGGPSRQSAAIDLTNDDGTDGEGDEPQITAVRNGDDVVFDEVRNNGPVCLGVIAAIVLCMYGLPDTLVTEGPGAENPHLDTDPLYARENWPRHQATGQPTVSHWWTQPGYRPVVIRPTYPTGTAAQSVQRTAGQWSYGGNHPALQTPKPEMKVMAVLSPMAHMQKQARMGIPPQQRSLNGHASEAFGALSDKFTNALEPLISRGLINMEARCKLTKAHKKGHFLHSVELLTFCTRPSINFVVETLMKASVSIAAPHDGQFRSDDYPGQPPLITGHHSASAQALMRAPSTSRYGIGLGGGTSYVRVSTREMTDSERKKQIETVYDQLIAGEDLPLAQTSPLIKTHLFSHQRQGVSFLLERERERSFDEIGYSTAHGNGKASREDSISLWQVQRSRVDSGAVIGYKNIVTQHEQKELPQICRGAILADDMGLGKTITVIATIAATVSEALAFSREPLAKKSASHKAKRRSSLSGDDEAASEMASQLQGLTGPKKARRTGASPKKPGKLEKQKIDLGRARASNLVVKSRATLIVCPLTIVSNWEEQIKEHWAKGKRPRIYIYHGSARSQNPKQIADHDIVMTTYSTLASEFANQRTWDPYVEEDAKRKDKADDAEDDDDDDDFQMVDADGNPASGSKGKATKKRKRVSGKEAYNPLQRIDWFRIVLDEAHTIKEARTMQCKAVCNLTAQRRISLTGTPVQNRLDDLYSQIKFLRLEPFADRMVWNEHCGQRQKKGYLSRANKNESNEPLEQVALVKVQTIMKYLTLRRTKDSKGSDGKNILELPPKCTRLLTVSFDNRERAKYNELHERYKEDFKEMQAEGTVGANYATILQEILNLRMCCDHAGLVDASKDAKRLREGKNDLSTAIKEDGLTRERAARLFAIFCESDADMANCSICQRDLSSVGEDSPGGGGGLEDEADDSPSAKPVVTKCNHLFCSRCFGKAVGQRWNRLATLKADESTPCPACEVSLSLIMDVIQLEANDLASVRNASRPSDREDHALSSAAFGVDKDVDVDNRVDFSSKVRFLLSDLIPFSSCNPHSMLYDPQAPQLKQYPPTPEEIAREQREANHTPDSVCLAIQERQKPEEYEPIRSVIFSQWTTMLDRVQRALHRAGIRSVRLDGKMKRPDRAAALEAFKNDKSIEVFLISLRAGGFGLNLVSACRAYCVEPAWNPAIEQQALDRIHRLGQLRPVVTTKLITGKTIEEKMLEIQKRKQELAQKVGEKRTKADEKAQRHEDLTILLGEH